MSVREELLLRRRRECDDRRHYLAKLELLGERLHADASQLLGAIAQAAAAGGAVAAEPLIERHAKLSRSIAEIEGQIATARAALAIALLELRRHELAWVVRGGRAAAERRAARRFGIASRRR